jgi:hypothetical protein
MERTKAIMTSSFFGVPREAKEADENGPAQEEGEGEGEGTLVSSLADEPPPKRSKTTAAKVDIMDRVSYLFLSLSFNAAPA